jgi:CBS domain-containing protein
MSIGKICTRSVVMAAPEETVQEAAILMKKHNVGTIVIVDAAMRPAGILTDRDVAVRCVAPGTSPDAMRIRDAMSTPVRTVTETTPIEEGLATMRGLGVRRLPVIDANGSLVGIVSMDDIVELIAGEAMDVGALIRSVVPALP